MDPDRAPSIVLRNESKRMMNPMNAMNAVATRSAGSSKATRKRSPMA